MPTSYSNTQLLRQNIILLQRTKKKHSFIYTKLKQKPEMEGKPNYLTPASPTIPMAIPAESPARPQARPEERWA